MSTSKKKWVQPRVTELATLEAIREFARSCPQSKNTAELLTTIAKLEDEAAPGPERRLRRA